jgi:CRP-like cAMP-binding protein
MMSAQPALQPLLHYCHAICPLPHELEEDIVRHAEIKEYKKNEMVLKAGQVGNHASFVLQGLIRSYYLKDEEEITTKFLQPGSTITSIYSFYSRKPGNEYIVALDDTQLASFHFDHLQMMYKKHPLFNMIGRVITERYLFFLEIEMYNMRKQKAEDRYQFFIKHFPELLQKVPLKYIATYLGMNLETLSRIRGKKVNNNR